MGTWSKPLFARAVGMESADIHFNTASWSEEERCEWFDAGFLRETVGAFYTLDSFMDTGLDIHKILDYLDNKQVTRWRVLCERLCAAYPALEALEFHFYSSDAGFPYALKYRKGGDLTLCQTQPNSPLVCRRIPRSWEQWWAGLSQKETERWVFDPALYRTNVHNYSIVYWDQTLESSSRSDA